MINCSRSLSSSSSVSSGNRIPQPILSPFCKYFPAWQEKERQTGRSRYMMKTNVDHYHRRLPRNVGNPVWIVMSVLDPTGMPCTRQWLSSRAISQKLARHLDYGQTYLAVVHCHQIYRQGRSRNDCILEEEIGHSWGRENNKSVYFSTNCTVLEYIENDRDAQAEGTSSLGNLHWPALVNTNPRDFSRRKFEMKQNRSLIPSLTTL